MFVTTWLLLVATSLGMLFFPFFTAWRSAGGDDLPSLILAVFAWVFAIAPVFAPEDPFAGTMLKILFLGMASPGVCALMVGASTLLIAKRGAPGASGGSPSGMAGAPRTRYGSSHSKAALAAVAGVMLVAFIVHATGYLRPVVATSQTKPTPPAGERAKSPLNPNLDKTSHPATVAALKDAALQAWFGKHAEHEAASRRMLAEFAATKNANVAGSVAKLTCLRPIQDLEIQKAALALARKGLSDPRLARQQLTLGMAEYRSGHFPEAVAALDAVTRPGRRKMQRPKLSKETANFYRAMSLFQLGRQDEARTLFTDTGAKMRPLPADEMNPLAEEGTDFEDLIVWLAYKEARALIAGPVAESK